MRVGFGLVVVAIVLQSWTGPLAAHHAVEQTYDLNKSVTLAGVVSRVEWINPHAQLYLDVTRGDGTTLLWSIELGAPNALRSSGFDMGALRQGERIIVDVWAAKDGSQSGSIRALRLSDGRTFTSGPPMWTGQSKR